MSDVTVEFTVTAAADASEAEELLDRLFDAAWDVVCPTDEARREPCFECGGTTVNPSDPEAGGLDRFAPGEPCWACADSEHPGTGMPCVRAHAESGVILPGANLASRADRDRRALLQRLEQCCASGNIANVQAMIQDELDLLPEP